MTFADIALQRLANEHLIGAPLSSPTEVVDWLCAVQSQDFPGAKWGLAQRLKSATNTEIDQLYNDGKILRTHVLRPTWHFVLPKDIRWLLELTGPRVSRIMNSYNKLLELDRSVFDKTEQVMARALQGHSYMTRKELAAVLAKHGIKTGPQRLGHIVSQAELDGFICSGPMRGKQFTYALLSERAPNAKQPSRDESLAEITYRYFASHGPALIADCAWWSGLTMADVNDGVALNNKLVATEINGKTYWHTPHMAMVPKTGTVVHLLPNYDEFLISYKDYSPIFSGRVKKLEHQFGNALVAHIYTINGLVLGGWKRKINPKELLVQLNPLAELSASELSLIKLEAERYGAFLDLPAKIVKSL